MCTAERNSTWLRCRYVKKDQFQSSLISIWWFVGGPTVGTGVVSFWMRDDLTPWNLEATFTVSYNTVSDSEWHSRINNNPHRHPFHSDASHAVQKSFRLPLKLVARGIQQVNSSNNTGRCKITIGTNRPVVDLNHLFPGKKSNFFMVTIDHWNIDLI